LKVDNQAWVAQTLFNRRDWIEVQLLVEPEEPAWSAEQLPMHLVVRDQTKPVRRLRDTDSPLGAATAESTVQRVAKLGAGFAAASAISALTTIIGSLFT